MAFPLKFQTFSKTSPQLEALRAKANDNARLIVAKKTSPRQSWQELHKAMDALAALQGGRSIFSTPEHVYFYCRLQCMCLDRIFWELMKQKDMRVLNLALRTQGLFLRTHKRAEAIRYWKRKAYLQNLRKRNSMNDERNSISPICHSRLRAFTSAKSGKEYQNAPMDRRTATSPVRKDETTQTMAQGNWAEDGGWQKIVFPKRFQTRDEIGNRQGAEAASQGSGRFAQRALMNWEGRGFSPLLYAMGIGIGVRGGFLDPPTPFLDIKPTRSV